MSDYKWAIQMAAEEEAQDNYGKDFYELTDEQRDEVYKCATENVIDRYASRADALADAAKEQQ